MKNSGKKNSISVVVTVCDEETTIEELLTALLGQSRQPQEVIIVDGGSVDKTVQLIKAFQKKHKEFPIRLFKNKSNIAAGRNFGVKKARSKWIAFTDAGCVPNSDWLEELEVVISTKAMQSKRNGEIYSGNAKRDFSTSLEMTSRKPEMTSRKLEMTTVVAGYYYGLFKNDLQRAMIPYSLVMPQKVDPKDFLPASRSMMITKRLFTELGGFDERLEVSEDYELAKKAARHGGDAVEGRRQRGVRIIFAEKAKVGWYPRENLWEFFQMTKKQAKWDVIGKVVRWKVGTVYLRYLILAVLSVVSSQLSVALFVLYLAWAVWKNHRYVGKAWYWLPVLQVIADFAVMLGTMEGMLLSSRPK